VTSLVGGVPILPVYAGEIQARCLGASVESWDAAGHPVIGEVGELVVTEPMPSMSLFLWNDADGSRLRASYFEMFPGVWRHGDWIEITVRGTAIISGRSDSTINRGGVRIGTSEIYSAVLEDGAVIARSWSTYPPSEKRTGCPCSSSCAMVFPWTPRLSSVSRLGFAPIARRATCRAMSTRSMRCRAL
jgi:non-ribosomal peptide synthetase component E (peptide arylation enzyme)